MAPPSGGVRTESGMRETTVERRVIHDVVVGVANRVHRVGRKGNRRRQIFGRRVRPEGLLRSRQDIVPPGEYRIWLRAVCVPGLLAVSAMERLAKSPLDGTVVFEGRHERAARVEGSMPDLPEGVRFAGSGGRDPAVRCGFERSRSEEHTSELQSRPHLVCRLLLEKKK